VEDYSIGAIVETGETEKRNDEGGQVRKQTVKGLPLKL
jgi:hypothetical protein